ncbi:MAG: CapA family protein [Acidobacteriota bacterium]|nr:CapA family protein [Acidobacteriota bacterium]
MSLSSACQSGEHSLTLPGVAAADEKQPQQQTRKTPANQEPVTIAAVGDIMLASTFPDDSRMPPKDGAELLAEVTPVLSAADIAFGNLEGPLIDTGVSEKCPQFFAPQKVGEAKEEAKIEPTPTPEPPPANALPAKPAKKFTCFAFQVPTRYGKYLKEAGFDVLSVANNHASDFGDAGRASTRKALDSLGIKHAGSDKNRFAVAYLESKGKKFAFIGFAHNNVSLNVNDLETARRVVQGQTKKVDIIVVSFHGGAEGTEAQHVPNQTEIFYGEKRGNLRLFARTVIDAGADLVLGHGPHVLRGLEIYKNRLVAYSLGNFATYGWFGLKDAMALTMILEAKLAPDGKFLGGKIHAGKQIGRGIPVLDNTNRAAVAKVRQLSQTDFGANAPLIKEDGTLTFSSPTSSR